MKVVMVAAATICGRISPAIMGSPEDRRLLESLRQQTGASLIGAGTLRAADPEMLGPAGRKLNRIRAVVTFSGDISQGRKRLFQHGSDTVIFTSSANRGKVVQQVGDRVRVVCLPHTMDGNLSMQAAVAELAGAGVSSILIEGGGRLNYRCLKEGIVDEILLTLTPKVSGDQSAASLVSGTSPLGSPFLDLDLVSCIPSASGEVFLKYRVRKGI